MVLVKYVGPMGDQWLRDEGGWVHADRDEPVEMSDGLAAELTSVHPDVWKIATPPAAKPSKKEN